MNTRALLILCAMLFALAACATTHPAAIPTVALSNSASAFDHNSLVGQPAPSFTLADTDGQSYTFNPNDGKKHVIVFYMGYL